MLEKEMYKVLEIIEPDFGCEGRIEGQKCCDTVVLQDVVTQTVCNIEVSDAELYEKAIDEGDIVTWNNGEIAKIFES